MGTHHTYGGRAPALMAVNSVEFTIATILICLRLWYRSKASKTANWALAWIIIAWSFGLVHFIFLSLACSYGLGQHLHSLDPNQATLAGQWNWITQAIQIFDNALGKASVIAFIMELQGPTHPKKKKLLIVIGVLNFIICIVALFVAMFQCHPAEKLWKVHMPGSCDYDTALYVGYAQSAVNAASDFFLAFYPVLILWNLQMPLRLKVSICALLSLSMVVGVCAIMKAISLEVIASSHDPTWDYFTLACWANTEMWATIIIPSIPPLWPLFIRFYEAAATKLPSLRGTVLGGTHNTEQSGTALKDTSGRGRARNYGNLGSGSANGRFQHLESRNNSQNHIIPKDGIMVAKDITVHAGARDDDESTDIELGHDFRRGNY